MESWVFIACALAIITTGEALTVPTVAQNIQVNLAENAPVNLECLVSYSDNNEFFTNAAGWWKVQADHPPVKLSNLRQVEEPFLSTARFQVEGQESGSIDVSRIELPLQIISLQPADSGRYRCGSRDVYVEHEVSILEPVSMLTIRGGPSATNMSTWRTVTYQQTAAPADLVFHAVEGSNTGTGFFECVAEGGYPARVLSVELPDRDLTAHLTKGSNETYEGDVDGLMTPSTSSWVNSTKFGLHKNDHGKVLTCSAAVYENDVVAMDPMMLKVNVIVNYKPVINCDASYDMALNQANIRLTCMVQARPIPSDVSFFLEQTQHTIRADGVTHSDANAYATMMTQGDNTVAVAITFIKVQRVHYQQYKLIAVNSVGSSERPFTVTEGGSVIAGDGSDGAKFITSSLILIVSALLLQFC